MSQAAQTRIENDKKRAAQSMMPGNQAAQSAVAPRHQGVAKKPQAFQTMPAAQQQAPTNIVQQIKSPVGQANPGVLQEMTAPEPDPMDMLDQLIRERNVERFISSEPTQNAVTRAKLQAYFKRDRPQAAPDDLAAKVMSNLDWLR